MFTLYNKSLKRKLVHPVVGLWFTNDYSEAKDMLKSCLEYLDAIGASGIKGDFVIVDTDTLEEKND